MSTRSIIQVQSQERECDPYSLNGGYRVTEPDDGEYDDENAFDEGGDGVCYGGDHTEQCKRHEGLEEVECAVEDVFQTRAP